MMAVTTDIVAGLSLSQPERGLRFTSDSVAFARACADRCSAKPPTSVVDLGSGCGVIGLYLARVFCAATVRLVEIQPRLAQLSRRNAITNGLHSRVETVECDLRQGQLWDPCDDNALLVSNPPFFRLGTGRPAHNYELLLGKHEVTCCFSELLHVALPRVRRGRLIILHTWSRRHELVDQMREALDAVPHLRAKFSGIPRRQGRPPKRMIIDVRPGGPSDGDNCIVVDELLD